jgi:hypothetical protein
MALSQTEKDRLVNELAEVRKAKLAAIQAVGYSTGGTSVNRQSLDVLVAEEKRLVEKLRNCGYDEQGNVINKRNRARQIVPYD